ncbi:MAG TPA: SAM-dependent chlorinase/fluorinase [Candidatus Limnocylindria bacterium]|nr:SAM-dependent chlorinase/fluorinase [Candidatus Limnocylindria bacterium]
MSRRYTRVITSPAAARIPREWNRPFVSLLSDWGLRDPSPAICRGVVLSIAPDALIVDISHEVEKFNIRHGALLLWCALPFMPIGAHAAVVDPGVGGSRRPIAIETARGDYLVGPDNGLLLPGAERLGGIVRCHAIENTQYLLPVLSATFHGRDLFSPAAAHLALGLPLEHIGAPVDPAGLAGLDWPRVGVREGELETAVIYRDTFGNLKLAGLTADLFEALGPLQRGDELALRGGPGSRRKVEHVRWARTFGDVGVGECLLYEDSYGRLCLARNQGSAAQALRLVEGAALTISRPSPRVTAGAAEAQAAE